MNFWQRLRLVGSVIVLGIAALALVLTLLRTPDSDTRTPQSPPAPKPLSGTTGL